jgi:hypothetical protein
VPLRDTDIAIQALNHSSCLQQYPNLECIFVYWRHQSSNKNYSKKSREARAAREKAKDEKINKLEDLNKKLKMDNAMLKAQLRDMQGKVLCVSYSKISSCDALQII